MTWQAVTWTDAGTWSAPYDSAVTGQAQSTAGVGALEISGSALTSGVQSALASGIEEVSGAVVASQVQRIQGAGLEVVEGATGSTGVQSASGAGALSIDGGAATGQAQIAIGSGDYIVISSDFKTGQAASECFGAGYQEIEGAIVTASRHGGVIADGGLIIEGSASTAQHGGRSRIYGDIQAEPRFRQTLEKLLRYPHAAVFDKSPLQVAAIRFDGGPDASWEIVGDTLTVTADGVSRHFTLRGVTIAELSQRLLASGVGHNLVDTHFGQLAADVLIAETDTGHAVMAFTSLLWVLFSGYADEVNEAKRQVGEALRQMVLSQAEDDWLDVWGTLYGVARQASETDRAYAPRIGREAFRQRVNAYGIELAIRDATGWDVRIEEPWKDIFTLDESALSGPHKFYDGETIGYHLLRPVARQQIDWDQVFAIIDRNRAAGVAVIRPEIIRVSHIDTSQIQVLGRSVRESMALTPYEDRALLDYSLIEETSIPNHPSRAGREIYRAASWSAMPLDAYFVVGGHSRDYRSYQSASVYSGQYWIATKTWAAAGSSWQSLNAVISSGHSRS